MNENGRKNARNDVVGKPGRCVAARRPFELTAIRISGNESGGIHVAGLARACESTERRAISQTCPGAAHRALVLGALERAAGLREEDVVECRLVQVDLGGAQVLAVERADRRPRSAPCPSSCTARRARAGRGLGAEAREQRRAGARGSSPDSGTTSTVGLPISAFSCAGRALGDDPAVVDDPDAVGEHVRLLEVLRRQEDGHALVAREPPDLLPERGAALRVEARRRLVEEEDRRVVDQRRAQGRAGASCRPSTCGSCGRRPSVSPTRVEQRGRSAPAVRRRGSRAARPAAAGARGRVRNGSSAVSWSAAPIEARTFGPSRTTSKPATVARPAGGREQGRQHVHRRRLAGAVRAEKAVDLARLDPQVDPVDRPDVLELPDEALDLDSRCSGFADI